MAINKVKGQLYVFIIAFFVILGPENVYLDTKIIFPSDLETEIFSMYILAVILKNGRY